MTEFKKRNKLSRGQIISAIIFIVLMIAMVLFAIAYNPDQQFSSSFFEDVANSVQWK